MSLVCICGKIALPLGRGQSRCGESIYHNSWCALMHLAGEVSSCQLKDFGDIKMVKLTSCMLT